MRLHLAALALALLLAGCVTPRPGPPWPGAAFVDGPPTSALPLLPLRLGADGAFEGIAVEMRAYDSCGAHNLTAMRADWNGDETLRFANLTSGEGSAAPPWYADRIGQPARPGDFAPGQGALVTWRDAPGGRPFAFVLLRLNHTPAIDEQLEPGRVQTFLAQDFAAFRGASPSGCCAVEWHEAGQATRWAADRGHPDAIVDTCHFTSWDPYHLVAADLPPRPLAAAT